MHISRQELRAFPKDSPEYNFLHAVKQLRRRERPDKALFESSVLTLLENKSNFSRAQRELGDNIRSIVEQYSVPRAHHEIHRLLDYWYSEPYIRTFEMLSFRMIDSTLFASLLPTKDGEAFVITASQPSGKRVIIY